MFGDSLARMTARIITWNLERKRPDTPRGEEAIDHLFSLNPDVMVLTEARTTFSERGGYALWCEPPRGTRFDEDERKVVIWSKQPWSSIDRVGAEGLDDARFIAATTQTPIGPVRVLGVCIPWHMAEVQYAIGEKHKPWELHIRFLKILAALVVDAQIPTIVAGDFNQRIPRARGGNIVAAEAIEDTFASMHIATRNEVPGTSRQGIDHIALSRHLQATNVWGWSNAPNGNRLSDHDGAGVDVGMTS